MIHSLPKISNTALGIILIGICGCILILFMLELRRDSEPIDEFEALAKPLKPYLNHDSSIGILINQETTERRFDIQFVFAPVILQKEYKSVDTILIVQDMKRELLKEVMVDTIHTSQNENYSLTLGIKKRGI